MALAERAELVARLSLRDDFSGKLRGVESKLGSLGRAAGRAGKAISIGLGAGLAVGAAVTQRAISSGLDSLAQLEDATTSVDGAIKQMGQTGKITSGQIAGWANEIEASVQAAFDDKEITQAATTLIRYGKVAPQSLKETLTVMTDLAAKTGSVDSAASKLAKSLADPTHATRVLREVGVTLTAAQQKQIKAWVASGKLGKAQALILAEVGKQTKGAAAAMNGPYRDSQKVFQDVMEDSTRALAVGFLPILEEVRDTLSKELAKKETLDRIKEFGKSLAGGLGSLIAAAKKVPWDQVGDAFRLVGQGAKAAYDLFTGLPPWVQTAVLTGWGLNKLTGGALGSIVGELGKGLIKGILGINAGVVNINAAKVNAPGGLTPGGQIPPGGNTPGGLPGYGILNTILSIAGPLAILDAAMRAPTAFDTFSASIDALGKKDVPAAAEALRQFGENLPVWMGGVKGAIEAALSKLELPSLDQTGWRSDPKDTPGTPTPPKPSIGYTGIPYTPTKQPVPFSASDYAAKLGKAQVDAQIRAEAVYAHPLVTAADRIQAVSSSTISALSAKMGENLLKWKSSSKVQIEDRRSNNTDQTTAINRVQKVAATKLADLERKASEGKAATDRSGSAIVSATRNEQSAVVSALDRVARTAPTVNVSVRVDHYGNVTSRTATTMNRVTTGVGSAELQRRTG